MENIALARSLSSSVLGLSVSLESSKCVDTRAVDPAAHARTKGRLLLVGQFDVANPKADGRTGDAE
jgi:hypothetical protein